MFIEAIANPEISLKTRERGPKNLNDAFRTALRLESFMKIDRNESKSCGEDTVQGVQRGNNTELILRKLDEALNKQSLKQETRAI